MGSGQALVGLVLVIVIGLVFYLIWKGRQARQIVAAKAQAEAQAYAESAIAQLEAAGGDLTKLPDLTSQVTGMVLHAGERCFAICRGAEHVVEAHRTKYVGGSQGVSFRIAKGVRYHVGGFSGRPVTTSFEKVQDVGDLYITTERVAFAGSREVTSIAAKKLADVRIDGDHLWFLAENRKTPLGVKLNQAAAPVIAYPSRMLAESLQKA